MINNEYLYHFTSSENLIRILETMSLKLSDFKKLNDLNENNIPHYYFINGRRLAQTKNYIKNHCKILCFSQDYLYKHRLLSGINHPRMWAQYAQNSTGACIIINENLFLKQNENILKTTFYKIENIEYTDKLYNISKPNPIYSFPEELLKCHYKDIFYKKHIDWEQEHERRLFILNIPEIQFLSIKNCILYICLGSNFNKYDKLRETIHKLESKCFNQDNHLLFLSQYNMDGNISEGPLVDQLKYSNSKKNE